MIPKPNISENGTFDHEILTPFLCEWINDPKQVPLHVSGHRGPDIQDHLRGHLQQVQGRHQ